MKLLVTISELRAAADKLQACVDDFEAATNATKSAADTVAAGWEGDARNAFVEEQDMAIQWFKQVAQAVAVYIAAIKAAAALYEVLDIDGVNIINS